ncbi:MAG: fchA 1 [Firmicutes bacterium]|nr:fchA 1 [Bacillota bacterium]
MLIEKNVTDFIDVLASASPAPGGGSVSALAGSLGAALTAMVCRLTLGNEKYSDVQAKAGSMLKQADELKNLLQKYVDEDTEAFNKVMAAYKLPKDTEEQKTDRSQAIQQAMQNAASLPLKVAEYCLTIITMAEQILRLGNANAASDAAVAGLISHAGMQGAIYNVRINLASIKDQQFVETTQAQVDAIKSQAAVQYGKLIATADKAIG